MPAPSVSFDGISQQTGPIPPDTEGDVGPKNYVQYTNGGLMVFSKRGKLLLGPLPSNWPWKGFGGPCEQTADGDTIVLYDQLADRWLLSEFAQPNYPSGPFYQCLAVSKTGDPTGAYYTYAYKISDTKLNDYPKLGVWPDGYYMSANQFDGADLGDYAGAALVVFDRTKMLHGDPTAGMVYVDADSIDPLLGGMLPADLDGFRLPPAGAPEPFVEVDDSAFTAEPGDPDAPRAAHLFATDEISLLRFHVDWTDPSASKVEGPIELPTTQPLDYDFCGGNALCIAQPGTTAKLDAIPAQVMHRVAYRNFGDHESLVLNVTAVANGHDRAGVRWFELRGVSTTPRIYQEGTFAPGSVSRWMGSVAMDGNGDMAAGYSVSSSTTYPSIAYAGRLATDPRGELAQGEVTLVKGKGSQLDQSGRWGDYSSMNVDPVDDCTFWYTNEYYPSTSQRAYATKIAAFAFPSCDATPPVAHARPARATPGGRATLRFTVTDNKRAARARIVINDGSGQVVRVATAGFGPATGGLRSVTVSAPPKPGLYRWCVTALDRKRNASASSCAGLRIGS